MENTTEKGCNDSNETNDLVNSSDMENQGDCSNSADAKKDVESIIDPSDKTKDNVLKTDCSELPETETNLNTKSDMNKDKEEEFLTDSDSSEDDYESAEEGEIDMDDDQLKSEEEKMTEEEKNMKREQAQKYKTEGNKLFRENSYKEAVEYYSRAINNCPFSFFKERSIMYSNRAACYLHLEKFEEAIKDCSRAVELNPQYLKAIMRRAELYEKTEKLEEALADFQRVVELDPSIHAAREACLRLPDQIKEKNEKLKEEMMGKLKDLGNMILKPFGLSTNNFQFQQDPKTGGYSVNFQQNPES